MKFAARISDHIPHSNEVIDVLARKWIAQNHKRFLRLYSLNASSLATSWIWVAGQVLSGIEAIIVHQFLRIILRLGESHTFMLVIVQVG